MIIDNPMELLRDGVRDYIEYNHILPRNASDFIKLVHSNTNKTKIATISDLLFFNLDSILKTIEDYWTEVLNGEVDYRKYNYTSYITYENFGGSGLSLYATRLKMAEPHIEYIEELWEQSKPITFPRVSFHSDTKVKLTACIGSHHFLKKEVRNRIIQLDKLRMLP